MLVKPGGVQHCRELFRLKSMFKVVISVCMSYHNSETPKPICLKIYNGEHTEVCTIIMFLVYMVQEF